jgi:hypothetical protein
MNKYEKPRNFELSKKIVRAVEKFKLDLTGRTVLTEAATGNYVVTPIIAAVGSAEKVYAFTKDSSYGSIEEVKEQTYSLAKVLGVEKKISVITSFESVDFKSLDIVTNTGFLRPITRDLIDKLPSKCVIPLMYEPWEFREGEVDLEACYEKGIKVYGTNESYAGLRTMEYIGFIVLYLLLENKRSPFSSKVLLIGCRRFVDPVSRVLRQNGYDVTIVLNYDSSIDPITYDAIVILEHQRDVLVVGRKNEAFLDKDRISVDTLVIHICGNVDFREAKFKYTPNNIRPFGYMSLTTDFIDPQAVIDLHAAGLKVAEGMLKANELGLRGKDYKFFMERNYPALAFENPKFW